jgi:hypothetical protein
MDAYYSNVSTTNKELCYKVIQTLWPKQSLKKLEYDDTVIHRRNTLLLWIKQLKIVLACHHQFSTVIRQTGRISSLPQDNHQLNNVIIHIIVKSYVEGHWKYTASRPYFQDKGGEALKKILLICATFLPSDANIFMITQPLGQYPHEIPSHTFYAGSTHPSNTLKKTVSFTLKMLRLATLIIRMISTTNNQEYSVNVNMYRYKRGNKKHIDFTVMVKNDLITEKTNSCRPRSPLIQTMMYLPTSWTRFSITRSSHKSPKIPKRHSHKTQSFKLS